MSDGKLARNTTYYTGAMTIQKILAFIYFWFISNNLFPAQLGQYIFALSFTTLFSIFVDLGLSPILIREAAKNQAQANLYLKNVLGLKIPLAILTLLICWFFINITGKPPAVRLLVYLATFVMLLDSFALSLWAIFRARQNLKYESLATILVQLIIFSLGLLALKTTGEVKYLMLGLLVASLFNFFLVFLLLKFRLKFTFWPRFDKEIARYFLKIVPAFALAGIFVKIYNTSDSILLSYLDSDAAVGFFAVPAKVVYALQQVIPAAFAAAIFPAFSYYYATSKKLLEKTFHQAFNYLIIISLPITGGLVILIPQIIDAIWPNYRPVIPSFVAMALAIPFIFLSFPTGYLLNACDRQRDTTLNRGIITFLAVVLNVVLIPIFSFYGASLTFFITNFILLFLDFYWIKKIIRLNFPVLTKIFSKALGATLLMAGGIIVIRPYFPLPILVLFGGLVYFACLYLMKGFNFKEILDLFKREKIVLE